MSSDFDPYRTWLGIPPDQQPPNHYRLLGVSLFEDQPTAIEHAADQRMAHLRTLQTGKHAALSQKLLNEVANARVCLLNAEKKTAYDRQLRGTMESRAAGERKVAPPPAPPAAPEVTGDRTEAYEPAPPAKPSGRAAAQSALLGKLGEYELTEQLGQGGMGTVYKATHTKLGREVAVKVLRKGSLADESAVARFDREMRAVGAVDHPNIVRAMDAREVKGIRFLVTELVKGSDLSEVVRRVGPLPVADACELIRQAALGLECVHQHDLVHRDVKPSNLMLTFEGQVKLLDLGLARFQSGQQPDDEMTGTGQALGTIDYMAPEQTTDTHNVDIRADIYSLGCTLYKLLSGHAPFADSRYKTPFAKMEAHLRKPPPKITQFRKDLPKELVSVVGKMLAKDPAKRFQTPAEVADAVGRYAVSSDLPGLLARARSKTAAPRPSRELEATMGSQSTGVTRFLELLRIKSPPPPSGSSGEEVRTKRPLVLGAVGAGVLLVGLIFGGLWLISGSSAAPVLVFDWPNDVRQDTKLQIDGKWSSVPQSKGPIEHSCKPGEHRIVAERQGYKRWETVVQLEPGERRKISPSWKRQAVVRKDADAAVRPDLKKPPSPTKPPAVAMVPKPEPEAAKPEPQPKPPEPKETTPEPAPKEPKAAEIDPALKLQQELDAKYAQALEPVEAMVSAWDFSGAVAALAKITFDKPELMSRRNARGRELQRLVKFKTRIIAKINTADPPLKKSDIMLRGINGEVAKADEKSISAKLASGKSESHAWSELSEKTRSRLVQLVIDRESADDWLSAGLLAFASGDEALAEKFLTQAQSRGAEVGPYLASLAERAFGRANGLLEKKEFSKATALLSSIEKKYAKTPWFASRRQAFDATRAATKTGAYEAEADKLYAEAAKLFKENERFDLKPLVEKLKTDYADSRAVTNADRKPSFAEMEQAVSNLGKLLTVRLGGKADFRSIQQAINAAPPNSVIEIQDVGPYKEQINIPEQKSGLTIRGKKGQWPILGATTVGAPGISIERVVIVKALQLNRGPVHLRSAVLASIGIPGDGATHLETCVLMGSVRTAALMTMNNSVLLKEATGGAIFVRGRSALKLDNVVAPSMNVNAYRVKHCTIPGFVSAGGGSPSKAANSIIGRVNASGSPSQIDYCNVFPGGYAGMAKPGKNCISVDPQFVNPKGFDYRLGPKSPCRGKASDGGDLGVRYTPEMLEMLKLAFALRQQGIIKF